MSLVPSGFCVDNTEVTKVQYQAFLDADPAVQTDADCSFNTTYQAVSYVWTATTNPNQAAAGMDWCDARDYCAWAGKRLCGRIGGGSLGYDEHPSPASQWFMACSQGGTRKFSYGTASADIAVSGRCHLDDSDRDPGKQSVVGAFPDCNVVGTNVVDMLGNLQEWVDACETSTTSPGTDRCKTVGGVWYFLSSYSDCDFWDPVGTDGVPRNAEEKHIGFRCCAD